VHDTLVLISQGYHGAGAVGKFPIKGIIKIPNPQLDRQIVYMPLALCQEFYSAPGMVSSMAILIDKTSQLEQARQWLRMAVNAQKYEVMTWEEVFPELIQHIKLDTIGAYIMLGILYIIVGFGIFGTITIMTLERTREFAIMIAVGMKKRILASILCVETLMIGSLGALFGIIFSIPVITYFYYDPIRITGDAAKTIEEFGIEPLMYISINSSFFITHSLLVFGIAFCCAIFPVMTIFKMKVMESLRK
jgi:ABC-type lipoprotein release transport system permease subunit